MAKVFGSVAFILGLISIPVCGAAAALVSVRTLFTFWSGMPYVAVLISISGWVIPAIAIIFGIIGIIKDDSKETAKAGLILGIIGFIVGILIRVIVEVFAS